MHWDLWPTKFNVTLRGLAHMAYRVALVERAPERFHAPARTPLVLHPAIALGLAHYAFALPADFVRSAVVTAAMAPGVNACVFASLYNRGQAQAASAVLLGTAASVLTVSAWLAALAALV